MKISIHTDFRRGTISNSVSHLYSMGINSAARLSWLGLFALSIPAEEKKSIMAEQFKRNVQKSGLYCLHDIILLLFVRNPSQSRGTVLVAS